jgi:ComF family protein
MTSHGLARAGRTLLDLVYPPSCAVCGKGDSFLCSGCEQTLPAASGDRCERCWLPRYGRNCWACLEHPLALESLRSCYRFTGEARRLVLDFKFGHQASLSEPLGQRLAWLVEEQEIQADGLVPVPLRPLRQRQRGYNQASLLAREAGKALRIPVVHALERRGRAEPQAQATSAEQRRKNVEGAFSRRRNAAVAGKALLLVDDVATTGATLDACARVLLEAGATSVSAITVARED